MYRDEKTSSDDDFISREYLQTLKVSVLRPSSACVSH